MTCAIIRPSFIFHPTLPSTPKLKSYSTSPKKFSKSLKPFSFTLNSIDVSKENKPTSDSEQIDPTLQAPSSPSEDSDSIDKRRLEEKFAVLNTGIYECRSCGYKYDEALGDPAYPIPPGFQFNKLPDDWRCPTCGAAKSFFESKSVEIAGFAQNQQFGLGGNSLTSGFRLSEGCGGMDCRRLQFLHVLTIFNSFLIVLSLW